MTEPGITDNNGIFTSTGDTGSKITQLLNKIYGANGCLRITYTASDGSRILSFDAKKEVCLNLDYMMVTIVKGSYFTYAGSPDYGRLSFDKNEIQNGAELTITLSSLSGDGYFALYEGSDYILYYADGKEYWLKAYSYRFPAFRYLADTFERDISIADIKIQYSGNDYTKIGLKYVKEYCKRCANLYPDNIMKVTDCKIKDYESVPALDSNGTEFEFICTFMHRFNNRDIVMAGGSVHFADDGDYTETDIPKDDLRNWLIYHLCFHFKKGSDGYWVCTGAGW